MSNPTKGKAIREMALGLRVEKTAVSLADIDLFTVKGEVLITLLYGVVTGVGDAGPTTILLNEKADSIALCAATTVTLDAVGEVYVLTGDRLVIMGGTGAVPVLKVAGILAAFPHNAIIFDGQAGLTIELTQTGDDATHAVKWTLCYIPLEEGAYVEAA
jgi:hypothetical protein